MPHQAGGLLSDVRVIDLGRYIAAPLCAAMLADLGADVIRIEPPEGGADRDVMPIGSETGGALFHQMNRGKRSLAIDTNSEKGRAVFEALVATSDVVVVNLPPKALAKAGLDLETLRRIKPEIILTTITAYSDIGDDRNGIGFDGTGQALSGAMHITGTGEAPMRSAVSYVDYSTGINAAYATLAAIVHKLKTGKGQHVQASLLGTALAIMNPILIETATGARLRDATGNRSPIAGPSDVFAAKDGWVMIQVIGDGMFKRWAEAVGKPELVGRPEFSSDIARGENGEALSAITAEWCASRTSQEVIDQLSEKRLPCVRVLRPDEALKAPQVTKGGFFAREADPGMPIVSPMARITGAVSYNPAPVLGKDNDRILRDLGLL